MPNQRLNFAKEAPGVYKAVLGLHHYLGSSGLENKLLDLVYLRASQINGCAFCIDMHWKDLRHAGENEDRLYMLDAWRESALYTDREKAALDWTEAVTRLENREVPDAVYDRARAQFSGAELANLTLAIATINTWNRLNIAFRTESGQYQPGMLTSASGARTSGMH